jgi:hypothetical protein
MIRTTRRKRWASKRTPPNSAQTDLHPLPLRHRHPGRHLVHLDYHQCLKMGLGGMMAVEKTASRVVLVWDAVWAMTPVLGAIWRVYCDGESVETV